MKLVKIKNSSGLNKVLKYKNKCAPIMKSIFNNYILLISFIFIINGIIIVYLLIENNKLSGTMKDILDFQRKFDFKTHKNSILKNEFPNDDKEMIGLYFPEINFDKIRKKLQDFSVVESLIDLINQIEIKLIFLEKEINITKLVSFYTSRKYFLEGYNYTYDEKKLNELHDIINWLIIHKSNQLKGIASDKYLSCKYVELKLGKNLCQQRIAVYDKFEELNYQNLSKYGNIVLKISNSCWKNVFINNNTNIKDFENKMKILKNISEYEHGLIDGQFFHLYAKKRIIVEKQFFPLKDLYEFRFFFVNNNIKFIMLNFYLSKNIQKTLIYDSNFNFLYKQKNANIIPLNITSKFPKNILKELKNYAFKLSEEFPNFIRVDLYVFQNSIYFSELTFASYNGFPIMFREEKFVKDAALNFKRIDDDYY